MNVANVRKLAETHTKPQLEACLTQAINGQPNSCTGLGTPEDQLNDLAKAEFVRGKMDEGMTPQLAMRDLAARMRKAQGMA